MIVSEAKKCFKGDGKDSIDINLFDCFLQTYCQTIAPNSISVVLY